MMGMTTTRLAALAASALLAAFVSSPGLAQEKTKDKPPAGQDIYVGDVILADARALCDRVAGDDETIIDALEADGWEASVTNNLPFYIEMNASKDYPGAGRAQIWGFVEEYPTQLVGYCTFEIVGLEIDMPIHAFEQMDDLTGSVEYPEVGAYASMVNAEAPHHLLIQAHQDPTSFVYQVTDIIERD